jgi:hypothetical protein
MFETLFSLLFFLMSLLSGQPFQPEWELKARLILQAGAFLLVFSLAFFWFYKRYFWQEEGSRRLFWWSVCLLGAVVIAKFAVFYLAKGYLPDRLLFYALPSPKFSGILWLLPIAASLFAFWKWRVLWERWSSRRFLGALSLIFVLFSLGVAGLREGAASIQEPFTRAEWEYAGALPLVSTVPQFLRSYTSIQIQAELPEHARTHPPGYILTLALLQRTFHANLFWLAFLVVLLGGLFVIPVYYFWRWFLGEEELRRALPLLIFVPSIVMFSATSMDFLMLLSFWSALAVSFAGWKKGRALAFLGGLIAGVALLMNFLFLFFAPVFLFFFGKLWRETQEGERKRLILRGLWSLAGFLVFAVLLERGAGYSFVENFFLANAVHRDVVNAGASSAFSYLSFAFINLFAFFFYLGIPSIILLFRGGAKPLFLSEKRIISFGFFLVFFFVLTGLFQGEVERLWLFVVPLFVAPLAEALVRTRANPSALISLLVFQVIVIQVLFYTYW